MVLATYFPLLLLCHPIIRTPTNHACRMTLLASRAAPLQCPLAGPAVRRHLAAAAPRPPRRPPPHRPPRLPPPPPRPRPPSPRPLPRPHAPSTTASACPASVSPPLSVITWTWLAAILTSPSPTTSAASPAAGCGGSPARPTAWAAGWCRWTGRFGWSTSRTSRDAASCRQLLRRRQRYLRAARVPAVEAEATGAASSTLLR